MFWCLVYVMFFIGNFNGLTFSQFVRLMFKVIAWTQLAERKKKESWSKMESVTRGRHGRRIPGEKMSSVLKYSLYHLGSHNLIISSSTF